MSDCRIKDGKFFAPNGEPSELYRGLESKFGSEVAEGLFVLSETPEFKEQVVNPIQNTYIKEVNSKMSTVNPKVVEFTLGKELINIDKDITYDIKDVNGKKVFQIKAGDKGVLLGTLRTLPYKDGYKVDSVTLTAKQITVDGSKQTLNGIGLGTELYKKAVNHLLVNGSTLYSDLNQTAPAKAIWEKFNTLGIIEIVEGRYKVKQNPNIYDKNGEIKEKYVLEFNKQQKATTEPLSFEQEQEVKNVLLSLPNIEDTDTLRIILDKAFYSNSIFIPTYKSLKNSGIYTETEINMILSDVELQNRIKDAIDRLPNTENIRSAVKEEAPQYTDYTAEVNSFGKLVYKNPYLTEQEALNNLNDLDAVNSPSFQKAREDGLTLDEYREVSKKEIVEGELVDKKEQLVYPNATKPVDDISIISDIETLLARPEDIAYTDTTILFTENLQKKLKNYGIDVNLLERKDLLPYLYNFVVRPNVENTRTLNDAFDGKVEVGVIKEDKKLPLVHLNTELSEKEVFDRYSLVRKEGNLYQKVQKIDEQELRDYLKEDTLSELDLYKTYLKIPLNTPDTIYEIPVNFEGDVEYLTTEFEADFNIQKLNNEVRYPDFYSLFKVNEDGIVLVSEDPYSIQTITDYLKSGKIENASELQQYSLISKSMPDLYIQELPYLDSAVKQRFDAINNPSRVPKIKGNYSYVNKETLLSRESREPFVKTEEGVYELINKSGDLSMYTKLAENKNRKYLYATPKLGTDLTTLPIEFTRLEAEIDKMSKTIEHYNTKELLDINLKNFDCI